MVADTFAKEAYHGRMAVKSKKLSPCNKGSKCSDPRLCNGKSVFVTPVDKLEDNSNGTGGGGWRAHATKVCLTHISFEDGMSVLDAVPLTSIGDSLDGVEGMSSTARVTWAQLAEAAHAADTPAVIMMARKLKAENETLVRRLLDAQQKLIMEMERR